MRELWSWLFNNKEIQSNSKLRALLGNTFNFEDAVTQIRTDSSYTSDDKKCLESSLGEVFKLLDNARVEGDPSFHIGHLRDFLKKLLPQNIHDNIACFIYTLNQDLYMERMIALPRGEDKQWIRPRLPGIAHPNGLFVAETKDVTLDSLSVTLPNDETIKNNCESELQSHSSFYVKLHGSQNWYSSDGAGQMIIGTNKTEQIKSSGLFELYGNLFREHLAQGGKHLLVIGYSFNDEHINETIYNAAFPANGIEPLKLFVVDIADPKSLKDKLTHRSRGQKSLWDCLAGYYQCDLQQIFPKSGKSIYLKVIEDAFLR